MTLRRRATLTDVAGRAGVSPSTASYILNGRSAQMRISAPTQERVRRAAVELGYRPNRSARSLRTRKTATLGLVADFVAGPDPACAILSGASVAARRTDHLLLIAETQGNPDVEAEVVEEMVDRQVDGIIYATLATRQVRLSPTLPRHAVVLLNCVDPDEELPAVLPDDLGGARALARLLRAAGRDRQVRLLGYDTVGPGPSTGRSRADVIRAALAGSKGCDVELVPASGDPAAAHTALVARLAAGDRPAVLVCVNDRVALAAYRALEESGLTVPADVSVVSFDGSEQAAWMRPALTCLTVRYAEMGALAVRQLLERPLRPGTPAVVTVAMELRPGASLSVPAGVDAVL